jgi:hypothetical protein
MAEFMQNKMSIPIVRDSVDIREKKKLRTPGGPGIESVGADSMVMKDDGSFSRVVIQLTAASLVEVFQEFMSPDSFLFKIFRVDYPEMLGICVFPFNSGRFLAKLKELSV